MLMKRMLEVEGVFDPRAVAVLSEAFDGAVAELGLRTDGDRERAAKIIIDLARGRARSLTLRRSATKPSA